MNIGVADFKRILVPLDGSMPAENALRYVREFAQPDVTLVLLRVITQQSARVGVNESTRRIHESALRTLGREAEIVRRSSADPKPTLVLRDGDPIEQILRVIDEHDIDLVVMTSAGAGRNSPIGLGNVVKSVASLSPVPILLVHGSRNTTCPDSLPIRRIVTPLDGSYRSTQVLDVVKGLAHHLNLPVTIVTAIDPANASSPALAREAAYDCDLYRELFSSIELSACRVLNRVEEHLEQSGISATSQLRIGPIAETIVAATNPGDIVVLTSRRQSGGKLWPKGSVTERVLSNLPTPILLVPSLPEPDVIVSVTNDEYSYQPNAPM